MMIVIENPVLGRICGTAEKDAELYVTGIVC
jgi:hypothetical protein